MARILKWALGTILVLAVLVGGAAIAVRVFVSSDQMKQLAEGYGSSFLGRKIKVAELSIGLFSMEASGLVIEGRAAARASGKAPLLKVERIEALLNPTALLYKKISILSLEISGININASRDSRGRLSFQDVIDRLKRPRSVWRRGEGARHGQASLFDVATAEAAPVSAGDSGGGPAGPEYDFVIRDLALTDLRVSFASAAFGGLPAFRASCRFVTVEIEKFRLNEPLPVEVAGECAEPGAVKFAVTAELDPASGNLALTSSFEPFDLMPFAGLAPPQKTARLLSGVLGGEVNVSLSPGEKVTWTADLSGEKFSADLRPGGRGKWQRKNLAAIRLKTGGSYDIPGESARISGLEAELPFLKLRLIKGAEWNVEGRDRVDLGLEVENLGEAARWGASLLDLSIENADGGKFSISLKASRNRRKTDALDVAASISFSPLDLAPYAALLPPRGNLRRLRGRLGGSADVSYAPDRGVRWKADFSGKVLAAQFRTGRGEGWRPLKLATARLRSEGRYDLLRGAAEVASLEMDLSFATVRLPKKAFWNMGGKDDAELAVKIMDLGSAAEVASALSGFSIKKGDFNEGDKLDLNLALSRDRKKKQEFSVSGSATIDPIQVGPFSAFVPASAGVKDIRGVVGGKVVFLFKQGETVSWKANLNGSAISGRVDTNFDGKWGSLKLKSFELGSDGRYNLLRDSARVSRLDAKFPFGTLGLAKEARWNSSGRDEIALAWQLSDLEAAVRLGTSLEVDALRSVSPLGASKGAVRLQRDRRKSKTFSVTGTAGVNLRRIHLADYPNLEAAGEASVNMSEKTLAVSVPTLTVRERGLRQEALNQKDRRPRGSRPAEKKASPVLELKKFNISLSQENLMKGRIVSSRASAGALRINFMMDPKKNTNLRAILAPPAGRVAAVKSPAKRPAKRLGGAARAPRKSRSSKSTAGPRQTSTKRGTKRAAKGAVKSRSKPAAKPAASAAALPDLFVRRMEIDRLDFKFTHQVEPRGRPVVLEWKDLNLRIDNFNTRMRRGRMDGRIALVSRAKPAPLSLNAKMNPALDPPDLDGTLSLNNFDLSRLSPYAFSARGMEIREGALDMNSSFNLRGGYLRSRFKGKVRRLNMRQVKKAAILGEAQAILQGIALGLLKRKNDEIPVSFRIKGRLNDPSFSTGRAVTEALLVGVINKLAKLGGKTKDLGGQVGNILKGVLGGVLGGQAPKTPAPRPAPTPRTQAAPKTQAAPPPRERRRVRPKDAVKELENIGKDLLRGLFRGR
jgi:hypothetical protein